MKNSDRATKHLKLDRLLYQGEISLEEYDRRLLKHTHALLERRRERVKGSIPTLRGHVSTLPREHGYDRLLDALINGIDDYKPNY